MKRFALIVALVLCVPLLAAYTTMQPMPTPDQMSGAGVVITNAHSKEHDGKAFYAHYESDPAALPTNDGDETAIGFITPATTSGRIHMIIDVRADDESVWELREDPAVVLEVGSGLAGLNRFRDSANQTAMLVMSATPNIGLTSYTVAEANTAGLAGGTILESETLAIAGGPPFAGVGNSEARGEREWILAASTEYVIIITSSTINDTVHEISLHWYEDVDVNYIR